ncbi:MAG: SUMF1/EgtB/PvdO family nonheme iron enzyme [Bryobacteraceae bacterium]|nr:SUMF1/EgtB/PvdO family nonheme iron enzyme [Bryobacteraceae bacterium]
MACHGIDLDSLYEARLLVDDVFARVQPDSLYERPVPERHRLNFYIGHVEAFDRNLVDGNVSPFKSFDPELDRLFAAGIDPEPGQLPTDQPSDWPEIQRTREYCARTRELVDTGWNDLPVQLRHAAIEHRLMHAETLAYLLHNLPKERLITPQCSESADTRGELAGERINVPAGYAVLGRRPTDGFGWDNEFPEISTRIDAFSMDRWKVTNGAYLRFVKTGQPAPHYWVQRDGEWWLRRMFDEIPLPLDWPVWVTHNEATGYAHWLGAELPTEAQWQYAAWGGVGESEPTGNFDGRRHDPESVNANPASVSPSGVEDMLGNGWEWTSTLFRPFPGFEPFPFYAGYSANFFDDDHYVLKGASPRTDSVFLRRSFRNWFRKDYPYVFAAFRCIHKP